MTRTLTLRLATPADLSAVDAMLAESYPRLLARDYPPSVRVLAFPILSRAQPRLLASGSYWLALDGDGLILGAGGWTGAHGAGIGEVRQVATRFGQQRQGIGRAVMACVMRQASGAGVKHLTCLSTRTAVPFYAALGFRALGPAEITLRPGIVFPAERMICELPAANAKGPVH